MSGAPRAALGIIPACAGFTRRLDIAGRAVPDHPRLRGVYAVGHGQFMVQDGSSPLARGLLVRLKNRDTGVGIIPARAGFTRRGRRPRARHWDHPRSRGVYASSATVAWPWAGSSPLARGLRVDTSDGGVAGGIIPACAGFTSPSFRPAFCWGDHPRLRGVYSRLPVGGGAGPGSSPLARGLPSWSGSVAKTTRIIPACAGFTAPRPWCAGPQRDHPRLRGVYQMDRIREATPRGSSPLARGLPAVIDDRREVTRIIPACAGFTHRSCDHARRI